MKLIKINTRPVRVLASTITLLFMGATGIGLVYGAGLISPISDSLVFTMVFGAPDLADILVSGVITTFLMSVVGIIIWGFYKLAKAIYRSYS